jgi:quinolinate synthase
MLERRKYPDTFDAMRRHIAARMPEPLTDNDLSRRTELALEVNRLKREKNAIILGHNYMGPALFHSVPDYTGDSLELSRIAAQSDAAIIVFCGVRFMAETAKILNPSRKVLLPSSKGGCSLAEGITAAQVRALRAAVPGAPVVTYVNTYADVKAETDICCTSSNAEAIVQTLLRQGHQRIVFLPDRYLASNVAHACGVSFILARDDEHGHCIIDKLPTEQPVLIGWNGRCEVHEMFTADDIRRARAQVPGVVVLAHPECRPEVVQAADFTGSTSAMIAYVRSTGAKRYLLLTECSMGDNIAAENPACEMVRMCRIRCPHMQEITLEQTRDALLYEQYAVEVAEPTLTKARRALERMIAIQPRPDPNPGVRP